MRKIICLVLAVFMIVSMISCGNPGGTPVDSDGNNTEPTTEHITTDEPTTDEPTTEEPTTEEPTTEEPATEEPTTEEPTTEEPTTEEPTTEEPTTEEPTTEEPTTEEPTTEELTTEELTTEEPEPEEPAEQVFRTGYGRVVMTPPAVLNGGSISGFTNVSVDANGVTDDLYVTCLAVNDGEKTALFVSLDIKSLALGDCNTIRQAIKVKTSVPVDNIFISATHTHSSPEYGDSFWGGQTIKLKAAEAAKQAVDDLADSKMLIGTGDTTGTAFVRRYVMENGTMTSISPGRDGAESCAYEVSDATLQVVRFTREDKKDIVLTNWQGHLAHAINMTGMTDAISADITHYLRTDIEAGDEDTQVIFFAGASANLNLTPPHDEARVHENYIAVAKALAEEALEVMQNLEEIESGKINIKNKTYTAYKKEDSPEAIADAWDQLSTRGDEMSGAEKNGYRYLLSRNGKNPDTGADNQYFTPTDDLSISAVSIGELAFVTAPYEMFDNNGLQIKQGSPFKMTIVLTNSGGSMAYIPSIEAWNIYGGYETEATYYKPGTAEELVAEYLDMLEELSEIE